MTPQTELIYAIVKKKGPITFTEISKFLNTNSVSSVHNVLSLLIHQGFISKKACPTCKKDGLYERVMSRMPKK